MKRNIAHTTVLLFVWLTAIAVLTGNAFATPLGVKPSYPKITFDTVSNPSSNDINYDATTGTMTISALPVAYTWVSRKSVSITGSKTLTIRVHIDNSGAVVPDQPGDQVVITGDINANGSSYTGTLLTGKITRFGFIHTNSTTNDFDFRFTPNGGSLYDQYKSGDIGVTITSLNSTFTGNFSSSFKGSAEGTVGAIAGPHIDLTEACSDAQGQGPIQFSATITNTGTENLTAISCSNIPDVILTGVPSELAIGATATISGAYQPSVTPSTNTLTCKATGSGSQVTVTKDASATCKVVATPAFTISETCTNATAPGQPITITGELTNTGTETLTGFSCSDSRGATLTGVPTSLAPNAMATVTGSYVPATSNSESSISCTAQGGMDNVTVSASSSATCNITTNPALTVAASCSDAPAPGQPVVISAIITNSGNEALTGFVCTDSLGTTLTGVPSGLNSGETATITGSYTPTNSSVVNTVTCNAKGVINGAPVSANSSSTCNITTNPALTVSASCSDAPAPGQPITITATITNSGNEPLTGVVCSDTKGSTLSGVPSSLNTAVSATISGSYLPTGSGSIDTITCNATGSINNASVTTHSSATCNIKANPAFTIVESCTNAPAPGQPISISAVIANAGNDILSGFICTDNKGAALNGIPSTLAPAASATITGSYMPASSSETDSITCSAKGITNGTAVSVTSNNSTCGIDPAACIQIKKQVSTSCIITGSKDQHCQSDETKAEYCQRSDADQSYCTNILQTKLTYCLNVTLKQSHCGSTETKPTHCSKPVNDVDYCGKDLPKDNYCQAPVEPVCTPVWLDADSKDTAATMDHYRHSYAENGTDLLNRILNGSYVNNTVGWLLSSIFYYQDDTKQGSCSATPTCGDPDATQGETKPTSAAYRLIVNNCGITDLSHVVINDPKIGVTNYEAGNLKGGGSLTLTSATIPQLAQQKEYCDTSFVNSVTVSALDPYGNTVTDGDDAWVVCKTKTCVFSKEYWVNHPADWPVKNLVLGLHSYTQLQLLDIMAAPVNGNGLTALAQVLIVAKLNGSTGTMMPLAVQLAVNNADLMIGFKVAPPVGTGSLNIGSVNSLVLTLDSYNKGTYSGGPTLCGNDTESPVCSGTIGDFVWNDTNKNGVAGSDESGIAGVKVFLSNGKSTISDASGHYQFSGLCKGSYVVKVTPPTGMVATTSTSVSVSLANDNSNNLGTDFGFAKPTLICSGKIGNRVWNDADNNAIQGLLESGISGVEVTLSNGAKTVTDWLGNYQFSGLCAGSYVVTVTPPAGYTVASGTTNPAQVTLATNSSSLQNVDFGLHKAAVPTCTGVIGNYVWIDTNKNGTQEIAESGLAGVVLKLSNGQAAVSDAEGHYLFTGLCAGSYTITVVTPADYTPSPSLQGLSRALDSNGTQTTVTLGDSRTSNLTADFGFYKTSSCGCSASCGSTPPCGTTTPCGCTK